MKIITPSESPVKGFEPCPDPWAARHVFYNRETGQYYPARCKRWSCFACAVRNYYRVDRLMSLGNPERFITLTRAGKTPQEINLNLKHLIQGIRRLGKSFEYICVPELHENGQAHLHLMQRGDFIEQAELSRMWETYTAKSYQGAGSFVVDIRYIHERQNVKGYLMKYLKKTWQDESTDAKSWGSLQANYPGLNHYRMSRNWLPEMPVKPAGWLLVPLNMVDVAGTPVDPVDELFYTDTLDPLTPEQVSKRERRRKLSRAGNRLASVAQPLTAGRVTDN